MIIIISKLYILIKIKYEHVKVFLELLLGLY